MRLREKLCAFAVKLSSLAVKLPSLAFNQKKLILLTKPYDMKQTAFLLLVTLCIIACKKNTSDTPANNKQLLSTIVIQDEKENFIYDGSNRIISETWLHVGITDILYEVTYQPGVILINDPTSGPGNPHTIKYTLDAAGKPVQRIAASEMHFAFQQGPEDHYETDITNYHYDNNGLISAYDGVLSDSNTHYASENDPVLEVSKVTYAGIYTIENNNIKNLARILSSEGRAEEAGIISPYKISATENTDFFYDKNYPNQFDFTNTLLIKEFGALPYALYVIQPGFKNFPNKAVITRVTKDDAGHVLSTDTTTDEEKFTFTHQGFISTNGVVPAVRQFLYKAP